MRVTVGAIERLDATLRPSGDRSGARDRGHAVADDRRGGGRTSAPPRSRRLPTGRTPSLVAELAPGLTNNTPNVNQVTISGAVAYDNVFLLDGVDIGDNLFARPDDLFVEEAIEETQVLTSAVSAEYGRFSGGVVNAVTKRGGNMFSGSVRSNLSNAAWTKETPFEKPPARSARARWIATTRAHSAVRCARKGVVLLCRPHAVERDQPDAGADRAPRSRRPTISSAWDLKLTATPMTNQTVQLQYLDRRQTSASRRRCRSPSIPRQAITPIRPGICSPPTGTAWSPIASSPPRSTRGRPTTRALATPARACRTHRS